MLSRLSAQLHEIRLDLRGHWLRRQERAALRRLGEAVARAPEGRESGDVARLAAELASERRRLDGFATKTAASLEADRSDLRAVAAWIRPVVIVRGVCARGVLSHLSACAERKLGPRYEALGALVATAETGEVGEVHAARASLDRLRLERERRLASLGGTAHPAWARQAAVESAGLARAILGQLRSTLLPKAPALAGMAVGWWVANTYTDSHLRSALRTVGIGSGGTHVVSGSTFKAMSFWLPLVGAAVCAYLGERMVRYYRARRAEP
ncbi:MAG: hypothetical protein ACREOQ_08965 [Gemmatimonadales bacterium]